MPIIRPPRLAPRDVIRIVAPSGPIPPEEFEAGARRLADRYRLRYDPEVIYARDGFLAGPDDHRLAQLAAAFADREAKAVIAARGGYGLMRLLPFIDVESLAASPKIVVGFSDVTALLARLARAGIASIHGPVVTQLPRLPDEDVAALFGLMENPGTGLLLSGLESLSPGRVQGPLLGGNLEVFSRLLGTPFMPDLGGAILFLEEVGERPYRVDRLITHLDLAGVFSAVSAVVIGTFKDCGEPAGSKLDSPTVEQVIEDRLGRLAIPVVIGARIGHGEHNGALPYGTLAELDTRHGTLVALEGAVS